MNLNIFLSHFFEDLNDLDLESSIKEISALKNSQPPHKPTFIINQKKIRQQLTQKFEDCLNGLGFEHIVISGRVGGGKTHFLNWIESRMEENGNFYMVKFQAQETSTFKYNFIKTIIAKLFQIYAEDFRFVFLNLVSNITIKEKVDEYTNIEDIRTKYKVSDDLARLIYNFKIEKEQSAILRILGASHGKTEINKLKIKSLSDTDYKHILQFFIQYKQKKGYLLILLDEFEHAYIELTPAARRNFFKTYKSFIDEVPKFNPSSLMLITSVTEQYAGSLKSNIEKEESALWSRMGNKVISLQEFNPSIQEEFNELFERLTIRYRKAHGEDVNTIQNSEIRKRFFEQLGESTSQAISYRTAILTMLQIMDDLRMNKSVVSEVEEEQRINNETNKILQRAINTWQDAHHNSKPGMLKTSLEALLEQLNYTRIDLNDERASVLYASKEGYEKLFFIATVANSKALANSIDKCIEYRDKLSIEKESFETIFIYQKQLESKTIQKIFDLYPDLHPIAIDENELYNLLAFKELSNLTPEHKIVHELKDIINKVGIIKRRTKQ